MVEKTFKDRNELEYYVNYYALIFFESLEELNEATGLNKSVENPNKYDGFVANLIGMTLCVILENKLKIKN